MEDKRLKGRKELITRMKSEMLGPGSEWNCMDPEYEVISAEPTQRYCVGILYPQGKCMSAEADDLEDENAGNKEEIFDEEKNEIEKETQQQEHSRKTKTDMEDTMDENISMATKLLPSSLGITFISKSNLDKINVRAKFATYRKAKLSDCRIWIEEEVSKSFQVPEVFSSYYSYDKNTRELKLVGSLEAKQISYWYEAGKADDGSFQNYAYKMLKYLKNGYVREPHEIEYSIDFTNGDYVNDNKEIDETPAGMCGLKHSLVNGFYSYTIMMINRNSGNNSKKKSIFQPEICISTDDNEKLVFGDYAELELNKDYNEEEACNSLLYRQHKKYGTGLGVSADWKVDENGKGCVYTNFFPAVEVPQMEFKVDQKYCVQDETFSMKYMSDLNKVDKKVKVEMLNQLADAYKSWINEIANKAYELPNQFSKPAKTNIENCTRCLERMKEGISIISRNEHAWEAFVLANRAMFMQRVHIVMQGKFDEAYPDNEELEELLENMDYFEEKDIHSWRPFQLAFLLMSISSITEDDNKHRDEVDLIWFPTGGGKTEAYLGLTAFTIFYRKLEHLDESAGTTVIMRYTLRLLAAQQFTRASTLICACEKIRQESENGRSKYPHYELGDDEINIGLWVGGAHTPNRLDEASECFDRLSKATNKNIQYVKEQYNKFQVLKCPWCGTKMVKEAVGGKLKGSWGYHAIKGKNFYLACPNQSCDFNDKLPLQIVDQELYKNPPTLLFATVDKFAMLPWYGEIGSFFAMDSENRSPELIIQDELHLISGPLGSMVGLYETAIDYLCCSKGIRPKIIASTATICRAKEQCSALYNREVFQFPPQGIDESDSFFARSADTSIKPGRMYIGLMPAGKTKAMMESRMLASLLQIVKESKDDDEVKDAFWTLTAYFNSLKELGKCSTIVQNDVRDNVQRMANRNMFMGGKRIILRGEELTSRVSTTELNQTLNKLEKIHYSAENQEKKQYAVSLLLATNMISVGIDVDRLNAMVIVGQPKLTSEYIQASSRVGRKYPGVVFTLYDSSRSRDRSHYEQFKSYHESFYRFVEPTGVTPFSEPSRKRALHAVAVSLIRHGLGYVTDEALADYRKSEIEKELKSISNYITKRMDDINERLSYDINSEKDIVEEELDIIFDKIDILAEQADHKDIEYGNIMGFVKEKKRVLKPYGTGVDELYTFDTMTSMRNVDSTVNVNVVMLEEKYEY